MQVGRLQRPDGAVPLHHLDALQHVRDVGSVAARVHSHRPADASRDGAQEGQVLPCLRRAARHVGIQSRRPCDDARSVHLDPVEAPPEPDHHAPDAAVAHDQVRPDPHGEDRDVGRQGRKKG